MPTFNDEGDDLRMFGFFIQNKTSVEASVREPDVIDGEREVSCVIILFGDRKSIHKSCTKLHLSVF